MQTTNPTQDLARSIYRACLGDGAGNTPEYWARVLGRGLSAKVRRQAIHSAIHWLRFNEREQLERLEVLR